MLAADVKPSRLQRAKQKLQDILSGRKEGQTALVVFAGAAFDVVPLTSDNHAILALLDALDPSMMPAQGSRASTALEQGETIFKRSAIQRGTVVLLTDGVDADALDMAARLAKAGHRVSVIGVGTKAGAPIPASGEAGGFLQDSSGNIVIPRLDTDMLKQLADAGHGVYRAIRFDDQDINAIPGLKRSLSDRVSREETLQTDLWREEGPWLLLLMLPLLALAFRRGVLLSLFLLPFILPDGAQAMTWQDLWQTPDQQGQALMRQNKPAKAAGLFKNPDWKGAALYRAKQYKQAADILGRVDSTDGWYNRGNALAKAGDLKGALDAYEHALKLDNTNKDAAFNRDLVKKAMQHQQQSGEQKKSEQQKKSEKQNKGEQKKNKQGQQGGNNKDQDKSGSRQDTSQHTDQHKPGQIQGKENHPDQQSARQEKDRNQKREQKQHQPDGKQQDEKKAARTTDKAADPEEKEAAAALQQWLRRIPDDPGGLLRRKFQYQYQQQQQSDRAGGQQAW